MIWCKTEIITLQECCKSCLCICLSLSFLLEDPKADSAVSAVTGWISHLDKHLQRETNGPTSLLLSLLQRRQGHREPAPSCLRDGQTLKKQIKRRRDECKPANLSSTLTLMAQSFSKATYDIKFTDKYGRKYVPVKN